MMTKSDESQDEPSITKNGLVGGFLLWALTVAVLAIA